MSETTKQFHRHDFSHSKGIKREDKTQKLGSAPRSVFYSSSSSSIRNSRPAAGSASGKVSFSVNTSKDKSEKKEKKVYELPGQKHDPPDERDPLRIFYQSLYEQNPKSEMAQIWKKATVLSSKIRGIINENCRALTSAGRGKERCYLRNDTTMQPRKMMEHGLLGLDGAKRALEIRKRNQLAQKLGPTSKISKHAFEKHILRVSHEKSNSTTNGGKKASLPNVKKKPWDDSDDDIILKPRKKLNAKC